MLADNRLAELAGWDEELLTVELQELSGLEFDFDFEVTGFDTVDLDRLEGAAAAKPAEAGGGARTGARPSGGQLPWRPVEARLAPSAVRQRPGGGLLRQADGRGARPDGVHRPAVQRGDRRPCLRPGLGPPQDLRDGLRRDVGDRVHRASWPRRCAMQADYSHRWGDPLHLHGLASHGRAAGRRRAQSTELKNVCVWNKTNGGMGTFYRSKHEMVFVFKVGTAPHINNFGLGESGRYRTNVWDYAGVNTFKRGRMDELRVHPTVKPLPLVVDALKDCSKRGGIVLDPFVGSGTTLLAAEKTGRIGRCHRARPALRRRRHRPLAGTDRPGRGPCRERQDVRRAGRAAHPLTSRDGKAMSVTRSRTMSTIGSTRSATGSRQSTASSSRASRAIRKAAQRARKSSDRDHEELPSSP